MTRLAVRFALACLAIAIPFASGSAQPTPRPEDIPKPVAGESSLAGSDRPDISRFLNVRAVNGFTPSPRGDGLSYLTSTTGQPQVWVREGTASDPIQVTFGEAGVTFQSWSPAGNWIVYGADRGGNEREGYYLVSPDGLREKELLPPSDAFRAFGGWSASGRHIIYSSTERNGRDFDVYRLSVDSAGRVGEPRMVLQGSGGLYPINWRPDGRAVLLSQARGEADNDVYLLDVESGKLDTLFRPADAAAYTSMAWSRDSRGFYVTTNQDRDLGGLAYFDLASRKLTWIETPKSEVEAVSLSADGRLLAWSTNENGYSRLWIRNLQTKQLATPTPALPVGVYGFTWAPKASVLQIRVGGPRVPGDVWSLDGATNRTRRMTRSATGGLDPATFQAPEPHSFRSFDGETIHGLLYLPARPVGKPPVLVMVHGGPTSQARPTFNGSLQYLLTRGIAVLDLNFRGSTGYGKRFTRLDNGRLRPNAVKDMAAALDWLGATGRVDTSRAAVMGGSYGGYMTFAALTQLPGRFDAGVGLVGVSNWVTALEGASPQLKASDRIEYGNIDDPEDRKFFTELSPITHVKNISAPLMVLHGANDPRDPVGEADQLVSAIRDLGRPVEFLRFPDEGHGIRKLSNRVIAYRRIADFLERMLRIERRPVGD